MFALHSINLFTNLQVFFMKKFILAGVAAAILYLMPQIYYLVASWLRGQIVPTPEPPPTPPGFDEAPPVAAKYRKEQAAKHTEAANEIIKKQADEIENV